MKIFDYINKIEIPKGTYSFLPTYAPKLKFIYAFKKNTQYKKTQHNEWVTNPKNAHKEIVINTSLTTRTSNTDYTLLQKELKYLPWKAI